MIRWYSVEDEIDAGQMARALGQPITDNPHIGSSDPLAARKAPWWDCGWKFQDRLSNERAA